MSERLSLNNEELRTLVLDVLKVNDSSQFNSFYNRIALEAKDKGLLKEENVSSLYSSAPYLENYDRVRVQNILWDLIIEGIIRPGLGDGMNESFPFFHVTEKGEEILKEDSVTPYDPDSYLKIINKEVPNVDNVIIKYLDESLKTFRIGCLLSSTISLGCASEKTFMILIESFINAIENGETKKKFAKLIEGRTIKRQFDEFVKYYNSSFKSKLNGDLRDGFETTVLGIFGIIRANRNDSGHPTGKEVDREQLYANIIIFRTYLKKVYNLIDWLQDNKI